MADNRYVDVDYVANGYNEVQNTAWYIESDYFELGYVIQGITQSGEAAVSAASTLTSTAQLIRVSNLTATTTATFTATAVKVFGVASAVSATATLTATALQIVPAALTAFNNISLSASAGKIFGATGTITCNSTISAQTLRIRPADIALSAFNTVVSAAGRIRPAADFSALAATLTATPVKVFGARVYDDSIDIGAGNFPPDGKIAGNPATYYHTLGNPSPYGNISPKGYTITIGSVNGSNQTSDITTGAFASNDAAYGTYFDGSHMLYDEPNQDYVANNQNIITFWYQKSIDLLGGTILSSAWVEQFSGRIADSSLAIFNNTLQIRSFFGPLAGVPNSSQTQSFDFTLPDTAKNYDWHHYLLKIVNFYDIELFIDGVSQGIITQEGGGVGSWSLVDRFYVGVRRTGAGASAALSAPLKGIVKNLLIGGYTSFNINNYYGLGIQSKFNFIAAGFAITYGEASMSSEFALSATPYDFTKAESSMSSEFAVTALAGYQKTAEVTMQSAFAFTADPDEISGGVSLTLAEVSLTAIGTVIRSGVVITTLFADIAVIATTNQLANADITAQATLSATPYDFTKASATLTAQVSLAAEGRLQQRTRGIVAMQTAFNLSATGLRIRTTSLQMTARASVLTGIGGALRGGNISMTAFNTVLSAGKIVEFLIENTITVTEEQRLLRVALESTVLLVQMANGVNTITAETTDIVVPQEQGRLLAQHNLPTN